MTLCLECLLTSAFPFCQLNLHPNPEKSQSNPISTMLSLRATPRLFATATSAGTTKGLKPAPLALLPPIPLYRRLLRSHRKHLPPQMRLLGDEYIKSEFRAHRDIENPVHIVSQSKRISKIVVCCTYKIIQIGFLTEWQMYAQKLEGNEWIGEKMDSTKVDKMSGLLLLSRMA